MVVRPTAVACALALAIALLWLLGSAPPRSAAAAADSAGARSPAVAARTRTVRANGHRIGYRAFGRGSPVVLIEGYGVTMDDWDPRFLDRLARRHRVVEFDHRGIGRSTGAVTGLTIETLADDAAALIRALRLRRPTVFGHSMGGSVAQELALDHPRLLSRLVLTSPQAAGAGWVVAPGDVLARLAPPYESRDILDLLFSTKAAARAYVRSCDRRRRRELVPVVVQNAQLAATARWSGEGRAWERLPRLHVPTLVGVGTGDRVASPLNGSRIARRIPRARLLRFHGLRHDFFMERTDRFLAPLNRFIAAPRQARGRRTL